MREQLGFPSHTRTAIAGGDSVEASARIFMNVLEGNGTVQQNNVVVANAGLALYAADKTQGIEKALAKADQALLSGKALNHFKKLMSLS